MYLVEIITDTDYYTVKETFTSPEAAELAADYWRMQLNGRGIAVRVINLAFATRW